MFCIQPNIITKDCAYGNKATWSYQKSVTYNFFYNSALNIRDNQVSALFLFLEWHCAKKWRKRVKEIECVCVCVCELERESEREWETEISMQLLLDKAIWILPRTICLEMKPLICLGKQEEFKSSFSYSTKTGQEQLQRLHFVKE